jgi:hydroxymethylglutaryl-CoA lyase
MRVGVQCFESSIAGLGGCPFTKVAVGTVCTEDLVHSLQRSEIRKDIKLSNLIVLAKEFAGYFNREMPGLVYKSGPIQY